MMAKFCIVGVTLLALTVWTLGGAIAAIPLVQYTFDEASSGATNAVNEGSLGSAGDGIFYGNATRTTSTPGGYSTAAMDSPGAAGDYLATAGDLDGVDGLSTMTITSWVNIQSPDNYYTRLVQKDASSNGWNLLIRGISSNYLVFSTEAGSGTYHDASSSLFNANETWMFLATAWDQTANELKFYTGTETEAVSQLGSTIDTTGWVVPGDNTETLFVGTGFVDLDRNPDMWLDDFRIYGSALGLDDLESVRQANLEPHAFTPGDFNMDGAVDVSDLGILATNYGMTSGATWEMGDANDDGAVDVSDLGILATNYGTGTAAAAGAIPEPAGLALLLGAMPILYLFRRR